MTECQKEFERRYPVPAGKVLPDHFQNSSTIRIARAALGLSLRRSSQKILQSSMIERRRLTLRASTRATAICGAALKWRQMAGRSISID